MNKNIGKFIGKNLRGKYSQKFLDHAKQFARDALKTTSKKVIWLVIILLIKLQKFHKFYYRITE